MIKKRKFPRRLQRTALNIRSITREEHSAFKVYCAQRGYTMEKAVRALIETCVKNETNLYVAYTVIINRDRTLPDPDENHIYE